MSAGHPALAAGSSSIARRATWPVLPGLAGIGYFSKGVVMVGSLRPAPTLQAGGITAVGPAVLVGGGYDTDGRLTSTVDIFSFA